MLNWTKSVYFIVFSKFWISFTFKSILWIICIHVDVQSSCFCSSTLKYLRYYEELVVVSIIDKVCWPCVHISCNVTIQIYLCHISDIMCKTFSQPSTVTKTCIILNTYFKIPSLVVEDIWCGIIQGYRTAFTVKKDSKCTKKQTTLNKKIYQHLWQHPVSS